MECGVCEFAHSFFHFFFLFDFLERVFVINLMLFSDLFSRPAEIQFLENRMPAKDLLIQLMSEDIDEPVDAIINFKLTSGNSASRYTGFQPSDQG